MRSFMRVEFAEGVRAGNARLVLLIELPGQVMLQLRAERAAPQARALQVARQALPERALTAHGRPLSLLSGSRSAPRRAAKPSLARLTQGGQASGAARPCGGVRYE
jgi:hypothetical protein